MPISGLSGAPPETSAFKRPPKRPITFLRTSRSRSASSTRSPNVRLRGASMRFRPILSAAKNSFAFMPPSRSIWRRMRWCIVS